MRPDRLPRPRARHAHPRHAATLALVLALAGCGGGDAATGGDHSGDVAAAAVGLRGDFRASFTRYAEIYCRQQSRVRTLWANEVALDAARRGEMLPVGAVVVSEMSVLDTSGGQFIVGALQKLAATRRLTMTVGRDTISDYEWRGATVDGAPIGSGRCMECHLEARPRVLYTGDELAYVARRSGTSPTEPLRHESIFGTSECR